MKIYLTFLFALMVSSVGAQQRPLIAEVFRNRAGNYDSTAYYYGKDGKVRTTIQYVFNKGRQIIQPLNMTVYPETNSWTTERISFAYDTTLDRWMGTATKYTTRKDPGSARDEDQVYYRLSDGGEWKLYQQSVAQKKYANGKLVETVTAYCLNCSSPYPDGHTEQQKLTYDSNDSLIEVEMYSFYPLIISGYKASYSYESLPAGYRKTSTSYSLRNGSYVMTSKKSERYENGHLVLTDRWTYDTTQPINHWFDTIGYNSDGVKVYKETRSYSNTDMVYGNRTLLTVNSYGQTVISLSESLDKTLNIWIPSRRSEFTFDDKNQPVMASDYNWNTINQTWVQMSFLETGYDRFGNVILQNSGYSWNDSLGQWHVQSLYLFKYNDHNQLTERIYIWGDDTFQVERYYYQENPEPYKPYDRDFRAFVSPNPAGNSFIANVYATQSYELKFTLLDMLGRVAAHKEFHIGPGVNTEEIIPAQTLRPGCYIYTIGHAGNRKTLTGKLIISK
jgi:hypothetical protein